MAKQPPEKVFRIGSVSASVVLNEVKADNGTQTTRNVTLQRAYGEGEQTKYGSSFGLADLPTVGKVL